MKNVLLVKTVLRALQLAILLGLLAGEGWSQHTYMTSFPATENPISEGGNWVNGSNGGVSLWGNVQTAPGLAFGTNQPTTFGDPTAILTGRWGAEQRVTAVVQGNTNETGCCREAELRLRTTIVPGSITGYEVYCSVDSGADYCNIARWNGPAGSYCNIQDSAPAIHLITGDIFTATITGTSPVVITGTVTRAGNVVATVTASDTGQSSGDCPGGAHAPFTSGNPGVGFYAYAGYATWNYFGFSSFTATDVSGASAPSAPTGLTAVPH